MPLTARQQRFVQEYVLDLNATQAALRAGYSKKRARQEGSRLLSRPEVQAALLDAQRTRAARLELEAESVLRRLMEEADFRGEGSTHAGRVRALELLGKHLGIFENRFRLVEPGEASPFERRLEEFRQRYGDGAARTDEPAEKPAIASPAAA
jgi:phage terminase small subunit